MIFTESRLKAMLIFIAFACFFMLGAMTYQALAGTQNKNALTGAKFNGNCSNMDIITTSQCLQSELSKWYKYNMTNWKVDLSFEELKEQGGVCRHYADWYYQEIKNLTDFYAKKVIVQVNGSDYHEFTIISNRDAWCSLDQTKAYCFRFARDNEMQN
jgi:hypothetical protein